MGMHASVATLPRRLAAGQRGRQAAARIGSGTGDIAGAAAAGPGPYLGHEDQRLKDIVIHDSSHGPCLLGMCHLQSSMGSGRHAGASTILATLGSKTLPVLALGSPLPTPLAPGGWHRWPARQGELPAWSGQPAGGAQGRPLFETRAWPCLPSCQRCTRQSPGSAPPAPPKAR